MADCDPSWSLALDLDLGTADPTTMTDEQLVDATIGWDRLASWATARQHRVIAESARRRPHDDPGAVMATNTCAASELAPDEIGLALRVSRGAAVVRLNQAVHLTSVLSATLDLLQRGRLDGQKTRAICEAVAFRDPDVAAAVQDSVLPRAPDLTLAQLRAELARAVIAADPREAGERHREARRERRVRLTERDDGMASLWALLTAPDAIASYEWLSRLARSLGADDPRGMDARRADLLVDLLTGRLELLDLDGADVDQVDAEAVAGQADDERLDPVSGDHGPANSHQAYPDQADADQAGPDPSASKPPEHELANVRPVDSELADPELAEPELADPDPADPEPADLEPADLEPADQEPAETEQADPDVADSELVGPEPVDAGSARAVAATGDCPGGPDPNRGRSRDRARARAAPGKPLVQVTMPYSTLLGLDDEPCDLAGYGPIPAELAREIAADAVWKRLVTDPLSGALLDHGRTTYRPPAALTEFVRARDQQCRSPICRRRADNCELDHAIAWADGGPTAEHNLWAGCVHDHHLKHSPGWTVRQRRDGLIEWITPTGHHYVSNPHDYRPIGDPDPPLLRRSPGRDPVPEQLHVKPAKAGAERVRMKPISMKVMFGRTDRARPDSEPVSPSMSQPDVQPARRSDDLPPF